MSKKVTIVSFPWPSIAPYKFLSDLIVILEPICDKITIVSGNTDRIVNKSSKTKLIDIGIQVHYSKDIEPRPWSFILWAYRCIKAQLREARYLIKSDDSNSPVIFYLAYPYYLPQLIACKISGRRTVEVITRSMKKGKINIFSMQDRYLFAALDGISPESYVLLKGQNISKNKLLSEGARYIDVERYQISKPYNERMEKIGYIGRLSHEKGVMSFVNAIPAISKGTGIKNFYIGGTGNALDEVIKKSVEIMKEIDVSIEISGFIPEDEMPMRLNDLKLLIFPTTHAEGLPTIVLEAMASGTPAVTTSAGALTSVVNHGVTGFILSGVSVDNIAQCIKEACGTNLNIVSNNARKFIEKQYSLDSAICRWKNIINGLAKNKKSSSLNNAPP